MSLILDALNRAEQERQKNLDAPRAPALSELNETYDNTSLRKKLVWVFTAVVLLLAIGLGYWNRFGFVKEQTLPVEQVAITLPVVEPANDLSSSRLPDDSSQNDPTKPDSSQFDVTNGSHPQHEKLEAVTDAMVEDSVKVDATDALASSARSHQDSFQAAALKQVDALYQEEIESKSLPQASPKVVELYKPGTDVQAQTVAVLEEPVYSISLPAPESVAQVPSDADSIASLVDVVGFADIPWQTKMAIPSINYSQHNYRESGDSSIMINGVILRAGEQLDELTVEQIRRDGCVLVFRGTRFTLAALSGWINL